MEIQKIFSNVEDPEENLYSVLMTEEELRLFSEAQEEDQAKKSTGAGKLAAAGGIAMGAGLAAGAKNIHTLNKVSKRAGYKNIIDHVKNGTGLVVGKDNVAKAERGERMMKTAMKNKKVRALGVAANVGQTVGAGLLIGAGVKKAIGNKNKKD